MVRVEAEYSVGEDMGKGLGKAAFLGMGEGGKEAPVAAVFKFPQYSGGGMAQDISATALPQVHQAALTGMAAGTALGIEPEISRPEYRGHKPQ
jgi:hypothetical protein